MIPNGWKEVAKEAFKAFVVAVATELAGWGVEIAKERRAKKIAKAEKKAESSSDQQGDNE